MKGLSLPENVETRLSSGTDIPVDPGTVDVAYSNQVMEHLHPADAFEQVCNIYKALAPSGVYVCVTPNRVSGPHDISKYFEDEIATGFHLKEYTFAELRDLFTRVGFAGESARVGGRGRYMTIPTGPVEVVEKVLAKLPTSTRRKLANRFLVSGMLGIRIVGKK
jgi:SAM-dependent methyltransferase